MALDATLPGRLLLPSPLYITPFAAHHRFRYYSQTFPSRVPQKHFIGNYKDSQREVRLDVDGAAHKLDRLARGREPAHLELEWPRSDTRRVRAARVVRVGARPGAGRHAGWQWRRDLCLGGHCGHCKLPLLRRRTPGGSAAFRVPPRGSPPLEGAGRAGARAPRRHGHQRTLVSVATSAWRASASPARWPRCLDMGWWDCSRRGVRAQRTSKTRTVFRPWPPTSDPCSSCPRTAPTPTTRCLTPVRARRARARSVSRPAPRARPAARVRDRWLSVGG